MPTTTDQSDRARYDGVAEWYDAQLESAPHRHEVLRASLGSGSGRCVDIGCGTGRDLSVIEEFGWTAVGVELSADQLRLARRRSSRVVQGDAERLPFPSSTFPMAVSCWTSTDVDHFDRMLVEVARVLRPGGRFLFYGVHPCFNGPHVEGLPDRSRLVHTIYREARRHTSAPWWGTDGIRTKAGGMRHVPLAEFINAFIDAGLILERVSEPDEEPVPWGIVVAASKPTR
jgi:ubiquinone/menaquinone biosynthesis C-methylase UbiE